MTRDNSFLIISYESLFNAIENDSTDNKFKIAAQFLNNAVTDWPTLNLREPRDLLAELRRVIPGKLSFANCDRYLKSLDPSVDAWKIESVSSLLEIFDFDRNNKFDKDIEIEYFIDKITRHYLS